MRMHDEIRDLEGLRIVAAPTDRRAYDTWACDDGFCQQLLLHVTATHKQQEGRAAVWSRAIQRYWRDRCSRRELADELGIELDSVKSLLTLIRKAAEKFKSEGHAGFKSDGGQISETASWTARSHTTITAADIYEIAFGNSDAIAHAEEYRRLTVRSQLELFDPQISAQLENILDQPEIVAADVARADELKARVAKDDAFEGRPLFQTFLPRQPNYHEDRRGRPRKAVRKQINPVPIDLPVAPEIFVAPETKINFNDASEAA